MSEWTILDPHATPGDGQRHAMIRRDAFDFWVLQEGTQSETGNVVIHGGPILLGDTEMATLFQIVRSEMA